MNTDVRRRPTLARHSRELAGFGSGKVSQRWFVVGRVPSRGAGIDAGAFALVAFEDVLEEGGTFALVKFGRVNAREAGI